MVSGFNLRGFFVCESWGGMWIRSWVRSLFGIGMGRVKSMNLLFRSFCALNVLPLL